jgi:hypothetical protein
VVRLLLLQRIVEHLQDTLEIGAGYRGEVGILSYQDCSGSKREGSRRYLFWLEISAISPNDSPSTITLTHWKSGNVNC